MGKQYQSQGKYARNANQAKKKRQSKPNVSHDMSSSSDPSSLDDGPVRSGPLTSSRLQASEAKSSYPYVASDLIYTIIIAGIAFVILVVLYIVL